MRCAQCSELLDDYIRGFLSETAGLEVSDHLAGCRRCFAEYESQKALIELFASEPGPIIAKNELADFVPGVWQKIAGQRRIGWPRWAVRFALPAAGAVLIAILLLNPFAGMSKFGPEAYMTNSETSIETGYYSLIDNIFSDIDPEALNIIENELNADKPLFINRDINFQLQGLSEDGLNLMEEKLRNLINNAG